jgi:hypothetical protein
MGSWRASGTQVVGRTSPSAPITGRSRAGDRCLSPIADRPRRLASSRPIAGRPTLTTEPSTKPRLDAKIVVVSTIPGLGGSRARPLDPRSRVRLARVEDRMLDALKMREGRKWKVADEAGSKTPSISRTWTRLFPSSPSSPPGLAGPVPAARCRRTVSPSRGISAE